MRFNQAQELIKKLQNENVMQFELPRRGCGFVKKNGELLLYNGYTLKSFGYFNGHLKGNGEVDNYCFIYQTGKFDIPEIICNLDETQSKDLYAFAKKLVHFFSDHPSYKSERAHDWDVLLKDDKKYKIKIDTPLARAGFKLV